MNSNPNPKGYISPPPPSGLIKPFTAVELFGIYESAMGKITLENSQEAWEQIGRNKKAAWQNLARIVNDRMFEESQSAPQSKP